MVSDGRYDSPGLSANYCAYSMVDTAGGKIVDLVQVIKTGTSQSMEKYGFCKALDRLIATQVNVATVVADRDVGIRAQI